jgi:hypothetical protein
VFQQVIRPFSARVAKHMAETLRPAVQGCQILPKQQASHGASSFVAAGLPDLLSSQSAETTAVQSAFSPLYAAAATAARGQAVVASHSSAVLSEPSVHPPSLVHRALPSFTAAGPSLLIMSAAGHPQPLTVQPFNRPTSGEAAAVQLRHDVAGRQSEGVAGETAAGEGGKALVKAALLQGHDRLEEATVTAAPAGGRKLMNGSMPALSVVSALLPKGHP